MDLAISIAPFETGGGPKSWAKCRSDALLAQMFSPMPSSSDAATAVAARRSQGDGGGCRRQSPQADCVLPIPSSVPFRSVGRRPSCSPSPGQRPGDAVRSSSSVGPTGQWFAEWLARWADNVGLTGPTSPGRCPGLGEQCSFGAICNSSATAESTFPRSSGRTPRGVNRFNRCSTSSFIAVASQTRLAFSPRPSDTALPPFPAAGRSLG